MPILSVTHNFHSPIFNSLTISSSANTDNGNSNWNSNYLSLIVMTHTKTERILLKLCCVLFANVENVAVASCFSFHLNERSVCRRRWQHHQMIFSVCSSLAGICAYEFPCDLFALCDHRLACLVFCLFAKHHQHLDTSKKKHVHIASICHASGVNSINKFRVYII